MIYDVMVMPPPSSGHLEKCGRKDKNTKHYNSLRNSVQFEQTTKISVVIQGEAERVRCFYKCEINRCHLAANLIDFQLVIGRVEFVTPL